MPTIDQQTYLLLQLLYQQELQKCSLNTEQTSRFRNFVTEGLESLGISSGTLDEEMFFSPESVKIEDKNILNVLENFYLVKNKIEAINLIYKNNE